MKEFKGTKGPLERKYVSGICIGIGTAGDYAEMTANSILPDIDDTDKQYKANMERLNADMQLYACSPEMLEMLQKWAILNEEHYKDLSGLIRKTREIIEKATTI